MPTINFPPVVRFVLYLVGAVLLLFVSYAVDKSWAGDAEVRLATGFVALLQLLAAAKTDLSGQAPILTGTVVDRATGRAGDFDATVETTDETGSTRVADIAVAVALLILVAALLSAFVPIV